MHFPKHLRVGGVNVRNVFTWDNITGAGAFEGKLLRYLSEALHFSYDVVMEPNGDFGSSDEKGVGTGLIGMVQRGEVDMGLSYLSITDKRDMAVAFSYPYNVMERTFATEKPGYVDKFAAFTFPFSIGVWIGCFCSLLAAAFIFKKIVYRHADHSYLDMFILALGSILSQATKNPKSSRVIYVSWLVVTTFIPFVYSALLLSFLTLPMRQREIKTFQELSFAVVDEGRLKVLAPNGTVDLEILRTSETPYLRRLGSIIHENGWVFLPGPEHMKNLPNVSTAVIGPKQLLVLRIGYGPFLQKFMSDDTFGTWHVGVAVGKSFCCKKLLDKAVLRLLAGGLHNKWFNDEAFDANLRRHTKNPEYEDEDSHPTGPLSLEDLKGVFLLLSIGLIFSMLVLIGEIMFAKINCKKKRDF